MDNNVTKKAKKQSNFVKAVCITVGVILVIIGLLYAFRNPLIKVLFKPENVDQSNNFNPVDADNEIEENYNVVLSEDVFNFLIVGHDRAAKLTDVAMLVNFNVADSTVRIMQLPRDTYVKYDDYWYHKINGVYRYNLEKDKDNTSLEGIAGYAEFLEKNLCVKIHYYAIMDLDQFVNIVDALGGVEIDVPQDMKYHDPNQNLTINLKKGKQVLNGAQSEQFVRYRASFAQGDIGRVNMQKVFLAALFKTVQKNVNITNIGNLCTIINDNLTTNMSTTDMIYFANIAFKLNLKNVVMMTLPGQAAPGSDGLSYYNMNRKAALEYVNDYFNIYDTEITDDIFDVDRVFDSGTYIYKSETIEGIVYDAEMLTEGDELPPT